MNGPTPGRGSAAPARERDLATALEQAISQRVGEQRYQLWFATHTKFQFADGTLTVGVPNRHFEEWLQKKFVAEVTAAAVEVCAAPVEVRFTIDPALFQAARRAQAEAEAATTGATGATDDAAAPTDDAASGRPGLAPTSVKPARGANSSGADLPTRRWRRLEEFVSGACNRVAHAAAQSVIESPGQGANPLVLYGPLGTGKTHLLEGICAGLRRAWPHWRVLFLTGEEFTSRFIQAMRHGRIVPFRKQFRECDALLVDDLHFLAGKRATREEFLHTFDVLQGEGKQIVLTCACHPRLADEFPAGLTDRLLGGVAWGLTPPDPAGRLAILQAKAAQGAPLSDELLRYLAMNLNGNVRELEGALASLRHYARVTGRPADIALAREALADLLRRGVRIVQLADIDRAVCLALDLKAGALQSKSRSWAVSHPRMVAMFLARKHTSAVYEAIGAHFGGRNHSTVVAAEAKVRHWLETDSDLTLVDRRVRLRELVDRIERDLLGPRE